MAYERILAASAERKKLRSHRRRSACGEALNQLVGISASRRGSRNGSGTPESALGIDAKQGVRSFASRNSKIGDDERELITGLGLACAPPPSPPASPPPPPPHRATQPPPRLEPRLKSPPPAIPPQAPRATD